VLDATQAWPRSTPRYVSAFSRRFMPGASNRSVRIPLPFYVRRFVYGANIQMKLVITVVHDRDKIRLRKPAAERIQVTKIEAPSFLREGNVTLLSAWKKRSGPARPGHQRQLQNAEQFVNVLPPDAAPVGTFMPSPVKVLVGGAVCF